MEPTPPNNEGADPSPSSLLHFTFRNHQVPVTFDPSVISWEQATAALHSEPFETWCRRCERRVPLVSSSSSSSPHNDATANQTQQKQQQEEYQQLQLHSVELQSIDMFGPRRVGFIKLQSHVTLATVSVNPEDGSETVVQQESQPLPGICFLRGSAVSILVALFCSNNDNDTEHQKVYSLLVEQPRVPIGQVACWELPAGMVDSETETVSGIALQELQQECGIVVDPHGLVDLTELAFGDRANAAASSTSSHGSTTSTTAPPTEASSWPWHLPSAAVPPSPGGCDEVLRLLYLEKTVTAQELTAMQGRLQGLRSEGEYITLRVVPMDQVWKVSGDAKAMMYVPPTIPIYSKCL